MESPLIMADAVSLDDVSGNITPTSFIGEVNNSYRFDSSFLEDLDPCDSKNPQFNCSLDDYLHYVLGPKQLALTLAIPITVVYVLIFFTGVFGNMSVCVVIVRHHSMHTATNYYLFSLAVSDLTLLLLGLPNDISIYWHQYPYSLGIGFCKLRALLSEASSYVSVLTIVAFSTERYLAICHPLHLYTMSGLQRAVRIIAALWVISLVCALPFAMHTTIHYLDYPPNSNNKTLESAFCAMLTQPQGWPVWELSSLVFFLLPALVILVLYVRMGLRIRARSRNHLGKGVKGSVHGENRQAQSRKAIIRMLAAVVIAFFVCWAPFHAQRLMYIYGQHWTHFKDINEWMFSITGWLYYVSSTVNPILYNVMSNRYRVAFRETLCCRRKHSNNGMGFSREQSSFRETTIAANGEGSHLVRVRSVSQEPLHRSNTNARLSRHSTISSTISKDYNNVHKPKINDSNIVKKRNNNEAKKGTLKGIFLNTQDSGQNKDSVGAKRKEITFEKETSNLIHSDMEDLEMSNIRSLNNKLTVKCPNSLNLRLPDSRSDSLIVISAKKNCEINGPRSADACSTIATGSTTLQADPQIDAKQDVVVVLGRPGNGIKKYYPNTGFGYANAGQPVEEAAAETAEEKLCDNPEVAETCI